MAFRQNSIYDLGKSMKDYALAQIIAMSFSFISAFIMQIMFMGLPFMDLEAMQTMSPAEFNNLIFEMLDGLMIGFLVISGIIFALGIYSLVRYFQFISRLKTAKDETQDYHLQRAYKMELYGFIISLALPIIIPIFFVLLLVPIFAGSYADPFAIIGVIMLILLAIIVIALIPVILQIVAGIALADWAEALSMQQPENYPLRKISDGVKNIKLGRILTVIPMVNILGPFVVVYGFWTGGKAIMNVYGGGSGSTPSQPFDMGQQTTAPYGQPQGGYGAPSMPSHVTTAPRSSNICPYCGTPKANPDASFCSVCGKEMR
ncbi:MAG: hypothetical protein ACTSWW_07895 [Promethearchaeota archaeon]